MSRYDNMYSGCQLGAKKSHKKLVWRRVVSTSEGSVVTFVLARDMSKMLNLILMQVVIFKLVEFQCMCVLLTENICSLLT